MLVCLVVAEAVSTEEAVRENAVLAPVLWRRLSVSVAELDSGMELLFVAELVFAGAGVASSPQPVAASETLSP